MLAVIPNTALLAGAEVLINSAVRTGTVVFKSLGGRGGEGTLGQKSKEHT